MNTPYRWSSALAALAAACALVACGGGGSDATQAPAPAPAIVVAPEAGAPASVGNIAIDGRNWINYRRAQLGVAVLAPSAIIDRAAQGHSEYQKTNNSVTHVQNPAEPGFTGASMLDRLKAAGYAFIPAYAAGEVISATTNTSGFFMAEELVTAIYHRFVMFEPRFKEIGTGAATTSRGYTYFTSDMAATNGYGPGLGRGNLANWPFNGQTNVTPNFFSDSESPDPVANVNEVGYPISVHADINALVVVQSFTIRPRGGAELTVKLLQYGVDDETRTWAAAIVPVAVLKGATTFDVTFVGTVDTVPVTRSWSFTTK